MVNPRDQVRFDGIGFKAVTYNIDDSTIVYDENEPNGSVSVGLAVSMSAADTVALSGDGEAVKGRLERVEWDGKCSVQIEGFMRLPGGAAAALGQGEPIVGALGPASAPGYIKEAATSTHGRGEI